MLASLVPLALGATNGSFTVYTEAISLRYGQVHNANMRPTKLPSEVVERFADGESMMGITGFDMDIVRRNADGSEESAPLYDIYLHHYILHIGSAAALDKLHSAASAPDGRALKGMLPAGRRAWADKSGMGDDYITFGGAAGAEFRHNPHGFEPPYRLLVPKPTTWAPTVHVINTRKPNVTSYDGTPSTLLQCPCTPQRHFDLEAGTIDGARPYPPFACDAAFLAEGNPACKLSTYEGGWRCCEDGVFVIDTRECTMTGCAERPLDTIYLKATFRYESIDAADSAVRGMHEAACCDATSDFDGDANVEYDVPQCNAGAPAKDCLHVATTVAPLDFFSTGEGNQGNEPQALVDLTFAAPHLHVGGLSLELQDAVTNATVCKVTADAGGGVTYGKSLTAAGDEASYLTGLRPCTWGGGTAGRFQRQHPMRTIAVYNASVPLHGVMSLWLMTAADVREPKACATAMASAGCLAQDPHKCLVCAKAAASELFAAGCQTDMAEANCEMEGGADQMA